MPRIFCLLVALLFAASASANPFTGDYLAQESGTSYILTLEGNDDDGYSGVIFAGGQLLELYGERDANQLLGEIAGMAGSTAFTAVAKQGQLIFAFPDGSRLVFHPAGEAPDATTAGDLSAGGQPPPTATRQVYVNRQPVAETTLQQLEQQLGGQIQSGRYWYDSRAGYWGMENGPAAGYIGPGLDLPATLPADISGGGTGIYFNGRELHPIDRQRLIALYGAALPGRYWVDAQGNLGLEGGPALLNLYAAAQAKGGAWSSGKPGGYQSWGSEHGVMIKSPTGKVQSYFPGVGGG